MSSTSINLLPPERIRSHTYDHYYRLGVILVAIITIVTMVAALQLLPAYIFLSNDAHLKQSQLSSLAKSASATEVGIADRLTTLSSEVAIIATVKDAAKVSLVFRQFLVVARPGIMVSNITYAERVSSKPGTLIVSGVATTRDTLHNYQLALQKAPFAASASLPVSAYAKDKDLPFSIAVTLAP